MIKKYIVLVQYSHLKKPNYYATDIEGLKLGDPVIITADIGDVIGTIVSEPVPYGNFKGLDVSPIIAKAKSGDLTIHQNNLKKSKEALKIATEESDKLKLGMNFIEAQFYLNNNKVTLTFTADGRVDFRGLLPILNSKLKKQVTFYQIGPRDKARATGGVGPCGRELCCVTFLKNFDGISINRAKNQQLPLNMQKLTGSCGKLMCCLLFEDETYSVESKDFPPIGSTITYNKKYYKVLGFNIVSRQLKCQGEEGIEFIPLKDIKVKK